jgi:predicted nucleic acid-binding Zn ribbon protein
MIKKIVLLASAAGGAVLLSGPAPAQEPVDAVTEYYARSNGISPAEAASRLGRLSEINAIEKRLAERFPEQFGGLYVVHSPTFKVVVKMTGNGQGLLRQITDDPLYVVEKAETPVKQLNQLKERIGRRLMNEAGVYFAVNAGAASSRPSGR